MQSVNNIRGLGEQLRNKSVIGSRPQEPFGCQKFFSSVENVALNNRSVKKKLFFLWKKTTKFYRNKHGTFFKIKDISTVYFMYTVLAHTCITVYFRYKHSASVPRKNNS